MRAVLFLGLKLGFAALLVCAAGVAADHQARRYLASSASFFNGSKVTVPPVVKQYESQIVSKITMSLNIAALKFPRRDAYTKFKKYTGGFEIMNKHYLASIAFVGIWGYSLALVSFFIALMVCCCKFCCFICGYRLPDKIPTGGTPLWRFFKIFFLIILLLATIWSNTVDLWMCRAATGVLFWGISLTDRNLRKTTSIVVNATDFIFDTTDTVTTSLSSAASVISDPTTQSSIQSAVSAIGSNTGGIAAQVSKIKKKIPLVLYLVFVFLNIIGAFILAFATVGLVAVCMESSFIGNIAFLGMAFLLVAAWLLAGIEFVLTNVTNDVCQAMQDFNTDPTSSSLSNLFPCQDQTSADSTTGQIKAAIKDIIQQANTLIGNINTASGFSMPLICDPYGAGPGYVAAACGMGTKLMANFDSDYGGYRCSGNTQGPCTGASTPITNSDYIQLSTAMSAGATISNLVPSINDILMCNFLHNAFSELISGRCVKLIDGLNVSWFGFTGAATFMMPLQLFWIFAG